MGCNASNSYHWRHNGHDSVSNLQHHDCLLRLLRLRSKKVSKLRVTGLCAGNSPETSEFPAQRASSAEMFSFDDVIMFPDQFTMRSTGSLDTQRRTINAMFAVLWGESASWWRHQMETFSALLAIVRGIHRYPVNSPHKGQWRGALIFSLICVWINGWVNNRGAGDLRRHRAHYDAIVMWGPFEYQTQYDVLLDLAKSRSNTF